MPGRHLGTLPQPHMLGSCCQPLRPSSEALDTPRVLASAPTQPQHCQSLSSPCLCLQVSVTYEAQLGRRHWGPQHCGLTVCLG